MKRETLRVPDQQRLALKFLVDNGKYPSKSEAMRDALRDLLDGTEEYREAEKHVKREKNR